MLAVLPILGSCGGGGNGGGGGQSLTFTLNQTSVTFEGVAGQTPPAPQVVTVGVQGTYSGTLYILTTESGGGLAPTIPISITPTSASATLSVASGLAAGTYSGQIQFKICSDSACSQQIGNSPITLSYTVTLYPPLTVSPATVDITAASGQTPTQTMTVQLPSGASSITAAPASGAPWLTVTNVAASSFTIDLASLPSGTYTSSVLITSGMSSLNLPVTYTVTPPAGGDVHLSANPSSLTLATVEDASTAATLAITPPSWNPQVVATVEYLSAGNVQWLTLTPVTGGQQVLANAASLSAGSYTAQVRLHGAYPQQDVLVPVALTVGVGLVRPADITVSVGAETTAATLTGTIPINVVTGPATGWSAATSAPWLTLAPASGQTGQSLTYTIKPAYVTSQANGSVSSAPVTLTPSLATMTPVTFNVNLDMNLPHISTLAPYVQLTGQNARVILRGSGFSSISSLTSRITIDSTPVTSATLVNDTEVIALFAPLSAGTHTVSASNALGLSTTTGSVVAIAEPAYPHTVIATGGLLPSLTYDPQRSALYAVNRTTGAVMGFQYSGTSWSTQTVPVTSAFDLGLSLDGSSLLVIANPGTPNTADSGLIQTLDPGTLTTIQSASVNQTFGPTFDNFGYGITTTNDARSWLGLGQLDYVTPQSLTPVVVNSSWNPDVSAGPWYAGSRDGERLIIVLGSSASPAPPMLYLNAADEVLRQNPAGLTYHYQFSLSEDGSRLLLDDQTLLDGSFNTVGQAAVTGYFAINGLVSPDGSRVYMAAAPTSTTTTATPRVFVFDATTTATSLPLLGYFDLPDTVSCDVVPNGDCSWTARGAIGIDGKTLFYAIGSNLYVEPVPATLTQATASTAAARSQRRVVPVPWPVNVR